MLKLEIIFNSGSTKTVHVELNAGADAREEAKKFVEAIHKLEYITAMDPQTGSYYHVKLSDASFVSVRAA